MKNPPITYGYSARQVITMFKLEHYVRILFASCATRNLYHNARHMLHVLLETYEACIHLKVNNEEVRPLLIAALLHDLDHPGTRRPDVENIKATLAAIQLCILDADKGIFDKISAYVRYTEYPHRKDLPESEVGNILRDTDLTQAFIGKTAWVSEVMLGLSAEWNVSLSKDHIDGQIAFMRSLSWKTAWAREKYPQSVIDEKILEYEDWKAILFPL